MASDTDQSYSWLKGWDNTPQPPIKHREGINNFLLSLEGKTREDEEVIKQLYSDWWGSISFKANGKRLSAGTLMNLHSDLTKAIGAYFKYKLTPDNSYHNPTGNHEPQHIALAYCRPPVEIVDEHNKRNQLRLIERVSNRGVIEQPFEIVRRAKELLDSGMESNIYSDIAAALVVLTGRRVTEILVTAEFFPCTAYSVLFTGQLKTRGRDTIPTEIPTLIEAIHILKGVSRLRELFIVDDTNRDLLEGYKDDVRRKVIHTFSPLVPIIEMQDGEMRPTTHRMRAVYNCLATFFYAPPGLKDDLYTTAIMAHEDRNSNLNYMVYRIADEVIAEYGGKRQGIYLDKPDVEVLRVFQNGRAKKAITRNAALEAIASLETTDLNTDLASIGNESAFNPEVEVACADLQTHTAMTERHHTQEHIAISTASDFELEQSEREGISPNTSAASELKLDLNTYRTVCQRLLKSPYFGALAVGLIAATGRSISELIKSGKFIATNDDHRLSFSNQLKHTEVIATLLPADAILNAIERLRLNGWTRKKRLRYISPNQIEQVCQPVLQRFVAKKFAHMLEDVSYFGLIAAYSSLITELEDTSQSTDVAAESKDHVPNTDTISEPQLVSTNVLKFPEPESLHLILTGKTLARLKALSARLGMPVLEALSTILDEKFTTVQSEQTTPAVEVEVESTVTPEVEAPTTVQLLARINQIEVQLQQLSQLVHKGSVRSWTQPPSSSKARQRLQSEPQNKASQQKKPSSIPGEDASHITKEKAVHRIDKAVKSVMLFNEQAENDDHKWFISESLIFRLTGCNRPAVRKYFQAHQTLIAEHNQHHQLTERHNQTKQSAVDKNALKAFIHNKST